MSAPSDRSHSSETAAAGLPVSPSLPAVGAPLEPAQASFLVDLRRCIGCHACSVACKTAHDVPLGVFPLRVRWLPEPEGRAHAFVPVFSEEHCHEDPQSLAAGFQPACVRACPTKALIFGDAADAGSQLRASMEQQPTRELSAPGADDLKSGVHYVGAEAWIDAKLNRGAALDPRDEDPIYEQR